MFDLTWQQMLAFALVVAIVTTGYVACQHETELTKRVQVQECSRLALEFSKDDGAFKKCFQAARK